MAAMGRLCASSSGGAAAPSARGHGGTSGAPGSATPWAAAAESIGLDVVDKVTALHHALALIEAHPLLALPEAAERIADHTGADLVGIFGFVDAPADSLMSSVASTGPHARHAAALLAAHGEGAVVLERRSVLPGADCATSALAAGGGACFVVSDAARAAHLPADFAALHAEAGLRAFAAIAVGGPGARPLGAVVLGHRAPGRFDGGSASLWLNAASTGLLQHLRSPQVAHIAGMLAAMDSADDVVDAISELLQGGTDFMRHATNLTIGLRLALVEPGKAEALVFALATSRAGLLISGAPSPGFQTPHYAGGPATPSGTLSPRAGAGGYSSAATAVAATSAFAAAAAAAAAGGATRDVSVRQMRLHNTLLASALSNRQARFVEDIVSYLQNNPSPARDVFDTGAPAAAAAVLVLPLFTLEGGAPMGAVYFTLTARSDFSNIKGVLLGFVHCISLTLEQKLAGQLDVLRALADHDPASLAPTPQRVASPAPDVALAMAAAASTATSASMALRPGSRLLSRQPSGSSGTGGATFNTAGTAAAGQAATGAAAGSQHPLQFQFAAPSSILSSPRSPMIAAAAAAALSGAPHPSAPSSGTPSPRRGAEPGDAPHAHAPSGRPLSAPLSRVGSSSRLFKVGSSRAICTDAMVKALQHELRRRQRVSMTLGCDLQLAETLGAGGFGQVYRGTWRRRPVAVKVLNCRTSEGETVSDAMEMAVLSSVQHPNIVSVFACLTDCVEVAPAASSGADSTASVGSYRAPSFRRLAPGEDAEQQPTFNVIVMEHCDRGTLADAVLRQRVFHTPLGDGCVGVNLPELLEVLIAVADSVRYLHGLGIVHGDIKLDNVLLKTDATQLSGFTPKLADFGLTKLLREEHDVINLFGAGTATHLAPELLRAGTRITTAADVYAWGIVMWECYTAKRAFAGLPRANVVRVLQQGARPAFPAAAPAAYAELASACWAPSPSDRPAFDQIYYSLLDLVDSLPSAGANTSSSEGLAPAPASSPGHGSGPASASTS